MSEEIKNLEFSFYEVDDMNLNKKCFSRIAKALGGRKNWLNVPKTFQDFIDANVPYIDILEIIKRTNKVKESYVYIILTDYASAVASVYNSLYPEDNNLKLAFDSRDDYLRGTGDLVDYEYYWNKVDKKLWNNAIKEYNKYSLKYLTSIKEEEKLESLKENNTQLRKLKSRLKAWNYV